MTPETFKSDVQTAYKKAIANRNSWTPYSDQTYQIFAGITVFGREAGVDLIDSVIGLILQEAVHAAEAKRPSMTLRPGRIGKAALAGMVERLREMTGLQVAEESGTITLTWE